MRNLKEVGFDDYAITVDGKIYSFKSSLWMKPGVNISGYEVVGLHKNGVRKYFYVHKLVATVYLENDGYDTVNHKDGNKRNNHVSNLEWCTDSYNTHHAYRTGLHSWKVVDDNVAVTICQLLQDGMKIQDVADACGVEYHNVYDIFVGKTFTFISCEFDFSKVSRRSRSDISKVIKICEMLQSGLTAKEIVSVVKCKPRLVYEIKSRNRHYRISQNYKW